MGQKVVKLFHKIGWAQLFHHRNKFIFDIIYNRDLFSRILEEGGRVLDSIDDSVLCINKTDLNIPVSVSFSSASRVIFSISAQVRFRFLVLNKSF
tara:strand:+ start:184 stop:468 length:285 start_codon:yes stop_codon:yes gene_type:complete